MLVSVGPGRLIGGAALAVAILSSVGAALIPLRQGALAPTPLEAVVPVVVTVAAIVLYAARHLVPSLCLAGAATAWAAVGLAVHLPSALELPLLRLGLTPLALVVVAALTLPTGALERTVTRTLAVLAVIVAGLAGAGTGVPALAILGLILGIGALAQRPVTVSTAAQLGMAMALIGLERSISAEFLPPRLAADGVSMLLMAGSVVIALILDRTLDMDENEGLSTSAEFGRRLGVALGASGDVQVLFPLGDDLFVDVEGHPHSPLEQSLPVIADEGHRVAVIGGIGVIEPALRRSLVRLLARTAELARLRRDLHVQADLLAASRRRLVNAVDKEHSRIRAQLERSVLARLDMVAVELEALSVANDLPRRLAVTRLELARFGVGLDPLGGAGLSRALTAIGERSSVVTTYIDLPNEPDEAVSRTAWFVASEGVANALKHAPGAPIVVEAGSSNGELSLRITDAGPGGVSGTGLVSITDRVRASGGSVIVTSDGSGTSLVVRLPLAAEHGHTSLPVGRSRAVPDPAETLVFLGSIT